MGPSGRFGLTGFPLLVYQQVAGMIGAFALAALVSHVAEIDWRGALAAAIDVWDTYVRTAVKGALDLIIVMPLAWLFEWRIDIPLLVRDYVSVGLMLFLSSVRVDRIFAFVSLAEVYEKRHYLTNFFVYLIAWPYVVFELLARLLGAEFDEHAYSAPRSMVLYAHLLALTPIIYFGLLVAANYFLLQPDP